MGVEKDCKSRIKDIVDLAIDKAGRRLLEVIEFQIECTAEARANIVVKRGKREGVIELVEKIIDVKSARCAGKNAQAESCLLYTSPSPRDRQKSRMPSSA